MSDQAEMEPRKIKEKKREEKEKSFSFSSIEKEEERKKTWFLYSFLVLRGSLETQVRFWTPPFPTRYPESMRHTHRPILKISHLHVQY